MKRLLIYLMLCAALLMGINWNAAFEADPAAGDPVSEGDDRIRDMRAETRFRNEVEHFWGIGDTLLDDNGLHRLGSARCYMTTAAPTDLSDSHSVIAGNTVTDYDNATGASFAGEGELNLSATGSALGAEDDVGHGRCWIDTDGADGVAGTADDNKLYIYVGGLLGAGAWAAVDAAARLDGDDEILAGAYNLVYNGSFEATDGTGDAASVVDPEGWTDADADIGSTYADPSTDIVYGDGYHYIATDGGAGNGEVLQTLILAAGQGYKVVARAMDDGASTCTLDITNEQPADFVADTTVTDVWETLTGTFTTDPAALDTVEVNLITTGVAGVCLWDHVAVYRIDDVAVDRDEISQPGIVKFASSAALATVCNALYTGPCAGANTGLEVIVTPPGPGYIIDVYASAIAQTGVPQTCEARLWDGANVLAESTASSGANIINTLFMRDVIVNPVPGTTLTLSLDMRFGAGACIFNNTVDSYIEAVLIPTR